MKQNLVFSLFLLTLAIMGYVFLTTPRNASNTLNGNESTTANPALGQEDTSTPDGEVGTGVLSDTEKAKCGITAQVTEGPYYVSNMPELTNGNLNYTNLPGTPLKISGHVYEGTDNTKPLAKAMIDIWQADNTGNYHPNANGPANKYLADQLALRGFVTTDDEGYYEFTTIYPGEYSGRTRHIHIKIRAQNFAELTTQLIVPSQEGDSLSFDEDTISRGLPQCHLIAINTQTTPASSTFDFRLSK